MINKIDWDAASEIWCLVGCAYHGETDFRPGVTNLYVTEVYFLGTD